MNHSFKFMSTFAKLFRITLLSNQRFSSVWVFVTNSYKIYMWQVRRHFCIFIIIIIFKHYSSCSHTLFLMFVHMLALLFPVAGLSCSRFLWFSAVWFAFAGCLAVFLSQDCAVSWSDFIRTRSLAWAQFRKSVSHLLQFLIHCTLLQLQHHLLLLQAWRAWETKTERMRNIFYNWNAFGHPVNIVGAV